MSVYESIRSEAHALIENAALQSATEAGGLRARLIEWGSQLLVQFIHLAEQEIAPGPDKKAAVLQLAGEFYDRVIAPLDLPGPDAVLDPLFKTTWLRICDYAVDGLVTLLNRGTLDALTLSFRKAG